MKIIRIRHGVAIELPTGTALPIRHIIGIGRNYAAHAAEQGAAVPERPMTFCKNPAAACVDGDDIVIPACCWDEETGGGGEGRSRGQVDYEAELAVVLGEAVKDATEAEAASAVLGYCGANDVSARWWQKQGSGGQFNRGKGFDTFCPLGPTLVSAGEIADPQALRVQCRVNGETMQDGTTADMIHPVASLIAELSRGTTLVPGTVILTGTPSGVGMSRDPKFFLQPGDTVEVEIDGIGVLKNGVVAE
ncbi:MAG: fumarylacetoacetate hydrolase family protein [Phycisphaeraceae bacterium]|nr:MAG: fumarylacetoacetate hydrolase family protein [Phycisphaeraceae bacterium]